MNAELRDELLGMHDHDLRVRRELIERGELYGPHLPRDWYHPRMAEVHRANNARMNAILDEHGWPGHSLAGENGAEAAWLIVQHAILDPELQPRALALLEQAVKDGEAPARHHAMLTDRVLMEAGEPQIYGSIHVGNPDGGLMPWPIRDPEGARSDGARPGCHRYTSIPARSSSASTSRSECSVTPTP